MQEIQRLQTPAQAVVVPSQPFNSDALEDPFTSRVVAKLAIADEIAVPLARLSVEDRNFIDELLAQTLARGVVLGRVRAYFRHKKPGADHAG